MKQSESLQHLAPALILAQGELEAIVRDSVNPHFRNRYASLDAIVAHVRPVLAKHGLAIIQGTVAPDRDETGRISALTVETMLLHTSGEWISAAAPMPLQKLDPQGAGGAITYGRRYGLSALLSLATDEDDDGAVASRPADRPPLDNRRPAAQSSPASVGASSGAVPTAPRSTGDVGAVQVAIPGVPPGERSASSPASPAPTGTRPLGSFAKEREHPIACPHCGAMELWDNRADKPTPKHPDYRCKKCRKGIWLSDLQPPDDAQRAEQWLARVKPGSAAAAQPVADAAPEKDWEEYPGALVDPEDNLPF